jgi:phosphotriesterase-related protein
LSEREQLLKTPATRVHTLTGPLPPEKLGQTLIHEHLLYGLIPPELNNRSLEIVLKNLEDAARVGIDTVTCLSPERDIKLYSELAKRSPVRLIASTGSYVFRLCSPALQKMNENERVELMVKEISEGIGGTEFRAGIIKVAGDKSPLTDWEKMSFRAAARAQKATGVPLATHAIYAPRDQFDILVAAGADPHKCFFSHTEAEFGWQGRNLEQQTNYLATITRDGGSLLFNNFGLTKDTPWPDLVFILRSLCDRGYANRILISVDSAWEWKEGKPVIQHSEKYPGNPDRTYAYMITEAVPALLKAGFSAQDMNTFLVDNPRRMFGGNP